MPGIGDPDSDFAAPLTNGDIKQFTLFDHFEEALLFLMFFPGAFTSGCRSEIRHFQADRVDFCRVDGSIYGIIVGSPLPLNNFRNENGPSFGLICNTYREIIDACNVKTDFVNCGINGPAHGAVFVFDRNGDITYNRALDDPDREPDFDRVRQVATTTTAITNQ